MADKLVPKKFSDFTKVADPTGCTFAGYNGTEDIQIDFSNMTPLFGISQTIGTSTTNAPSENAVNQALQDKADKTDTNGDKVVYTDTDNAIYGDIITKDTGRFIPSDLLALLQSYGLEITPANFFARNALKEGATVDAGLLASGYNALNPLLISDASVVLIPGAYKSGVVYGLNPRTGEAVNFDFSRATSGTYFDNNLDMHLASADMPRLDYGNYTFDAKILVEKQSINYIVQSEYAVNTGWFPHTAATPAIRIDVNWFDFIKTAARIYHEDNSDVGMRQNSTVYQNKVLSIFCQVSDGAQPVFTGAGANRDAVSYYSDQNYSMRKIGDIWRVKVGNFVNMYLGYSKYRNYNAKDFYTSGWQVEDDEETSYIPTTTAQVTRSADNLSYTLANNCSVYLKTTKQNIVLDKSAGLWNIHDELSNDGIIQLAIFDRVLTAEEKAQLTA